MMNALERRMLDMLRKGRDRFGVVAIKAEFEAEGTRPDELLRLLELTCRADLKLALKIGGCEAVSDLHASKLYGAHYLIAPMVETPYALSKFVDAKNKVYGDDCDDAEFLFNLETEATLDNLEDMLPLAKAELDGVVFGRVDFTQSCGLTRAEINSRRITDSVLTAAQACAGHDLEFVVGGSVAVEAGQALREIREVRLDRFETRKVIFDGAVAETSAFEAGIANAVAFELAWLQNKRQYYQSSADEDLPRIRMIEERNAANAAAKRGHLASVAA
jgi:hypothetical protein